MSEISESINIGIWLLTLGQLFRIERRMAKGDVVLDLINKHCPIFNRGSHYGIEETDCGGEEKHQEGSGGLTEKEA